MNNIRDLRVARGLTMRDLGEAMGVHFTTIAKIERSERRLTADWARRFADALGVRPHEVTGEPAHQGPASTNWIPVIGMVAAGNWQEAVQHPLDRVAAPLSGPSVFALRVDGESMNKVVPDGALVMVDPEQLELHDGQYYVIMNEDGEATFKQYRSSPARLEPSSTMDDFKPMLLGQTQFTVVGKVVGAFRYM